MLMIILLIPIYVLGLWLEFNPLKECKIYVDGKVITTETRKFTVKELLTQKNIKLGKFDYVVPKLDARLADEIAIKVNRVSIRTVDRAIELPFDIVSKNDKNLLKGDKKVVVQGKKGTKIETYEVKAINGVDKSYTLVKSKDLSLPKNQLVAIGTKEKIKTLTPSRTGGKLSRSIPVLSRGGNSGRVIYLESTAYTHTGNRTATGVWPYKGIVAVDPRIIPLGTKLYVEGYGYALAADTGGAIKGDIIDVFFDSRSECFKWGRRKVKVTIIN